MIHDTKVWPGPEYARGDGPIRLAIVPGCSNVPIRILQYFPINTFVANSFLAHNKLYGNLMSSNFGTVLTRTYVMRVYCTYSSNKRAAQSRDFT